MNKKIFMQIITDKPTKLVIGVITTADGTPITWARCNRTNHSRKLHTIQIEVKK